MLDAATKRNIDSARQILVGKVPDPKAQVEQITTALVYKFMDDMSKEAEELGGKAKFFTDDLKGFAWSKLLDARHSGQKRMDLYVRAIDAFTKAKQLPVLFRNFFKGAFLPYRDPETLSLFLKEINNFVYDHSENLGNAFEYLLSILGSQGDAGQFRTPRHIIDFIVEVVDPKKNETILDPACGTAGFLISAYKHILQHNSSDFKSKKGRGKAAPAEKTYPGDRLTPTEKKKLMRNFAGYDISPDMVKLSLVNMYLHGFQDPQIHEYDTLTSEDRWGEQFDVIMANPPFMTPTGGIRPHSRFSVQAKRSEVLFVDYILEHLNLKGRAGIIVPEGIIFKTENAYKKLRQMLIEDGLFSVVSLPPGVFNPYSGVKTSVLLFDNQLAQKTDEILFVKIENDGFDLGAQRLKIDKNDLPEALEILEAWKQGRKKKSTLALWAKKEKISESGDYNLTGERYKETAIRKNQKYQTVALGEVCEVIAGQSPESKFYNSKRNGMPFYQGKTEFQEMYLGNPVKWTTNVKKIAEADDILMSVRAPVGPVNIATQKICIGRGLVAIRPKEKINWKFLFNYLKSIESKIKGSGGAVFDSISQSQIKKIKIPLPPLEVQKEIVEQIEVKQKAIHHAKEVIKNLERERRYFGKEVEKLDEVEWVALGDVCDILDSLRKPVKKSDRKKGKYPYYGATGILDYVDQYIFDEKLVLVGEDGAKWGAGERTSFIADGKYWVNNHAHVLRPDQEKLLDEFLVSILNNLNLSKYVTGITVPKLNQAKLKSIKIPLPLLAVQKRLVAKVEKEKEIIDANRRLISLMRRKIEDVLSEI